MGTVSSNAASPSGVASKPVFVLARKPRAMSTCTALASATRSEALTDGPTSILVGVIAARSTDVSMNESGAKIDGAGRFMGVTLGFPSTVVKVF